MLFFVMTNLAFAAVSFDKDLYWNIKKESNEVKSLQTFLTEQGFYSGPITGNYLSQTYKGVVNFQKYYEISPTGYFGPISRAKANDIMDMSVVAVPNTTSGAISKTVDVSASTSISMILDQTEKAILQARVGALYQQVWALQKKINKNKISPPPPPPTYSQSTYYSQSIYYSQSSYVTIPSYSQSTYYSQSSYTPPPPPYSQSTYYSQSSYVASTPPPPPVSTTTVPTTGTPTTTPVRKLVWGAYVGDSRADLGTFETKVGRSVDIRSVFYGFGDSFPMHYSETLGKQGKTLLLFWEPAFGYDSINNGSQDAVIRKFATDAKAYSYPVMLSPFHEMNGNWAPWGATLNGNTPAKFISSWKRIKNLFDEVGATNVKFALVYNSDSIPNIVGNQIPDYYPGDAYVDYIGVDGFNFGTPWVNFQKIFEKSLTVLVKYNKPIYIFSMGSVPGLEKANWIRDALGVQVHKYPEIYGWVWFNQNGADGNWLVDSDPNSLSAFKEVIPK